MVVLILHNCCVPSLLDYLLSQLESNVVFLFHSLLVITVSFIKKQHFIHAIHNIFLEWLLIVKTLLLEVSRQMPCSLSGVIRTRVYATLRLIKFIILYIRAFNCRGTVEGIFQVTRYL